MPGKVLLLALGSAYTGVFLIIICWIVHVWCVVLLYGSMFMKNSQEDTYTFRKLVIQV